MILFWFVAFTSIVLCDVSIHTGNLGGSTIRSAPLYYGNSPRIASTYRNMSMVDFSSDQIGEVVLIRKDDYTPGTLLEVSKRPGVKFVVIAWYAGYSGLGCSMFFVYSQGTKNINVPVVEVDSKDVERVFDNNTSIMIDISPSDNLCAEYFEGIGYGIFQCLLITFCMIATTLCLYRLFQFSAVKACAFSLPVIAISIELLSNSLKFFAILDLFGSRQFYHHQVDDFLLTFSTPFTTITNIMITMYWHETLVTHSIQVHKFLKSTLFRVLFGILFVILIGVELLSTSWRLATSTTPSAIRYFPHILNFSANLFVLIYSTIIIIKLQRRLNAGFNKSKDLVNTIRIRMIANVVLIIILLLSVVIIAIPPTNRDTGIIKLSLSMGLLYATQLALSFLQVYSFKPLAMRPPTASTYSANSLKRNTIEIDDSAAVSTNHNNDTVKV